MINKLDLFWVPNFIVLGIYFIFGTKFSWNEGSDTCFNVEYVLLGCNFGFLGGYCPLTSGYCSLLLIPTFSMNDNMIIGILSFQTGLNDLFSSTDFYFKS